MTNNKEYPFALSVVLNLHREGKYLKRTLASIKEAIIFAQSDEIEIDLVIVLDCADELTEALVRRFDVSFVKRCEIVRTNVASLGLARNVGRTSAQGQWIALCDGDDLLSYNYFHACFAAANRFGAKTLLMPQWYVGFGTNLHFCEFVPLQTVTALAFLDIHPYGSRTFAHTTLYEAVPFGDASTRSGYAFEDWHHNSEVVAAGFDIQIAEDAVVFYRQRASGLMGAARSSAHAPQIPPSSLFRPDVFRSTCWSAVDRLARGDDPRKNYASVGRAVFEYPSMLAFMAAANKIDPSIDPLNLRHSPEYSVKMASNLDVGVAYFHLCERLRHRDFTDIVIVPFFGKGGGERYFINLIAALVGQDRSVLVIMGEWHPTNEWLKRLPREVEVLDLFPLSQRIGVVSADVLVLKIVQSYQQAVVHVRDSNFGHRLVERFGRLLPNILIFYMFCEVRHIHEGILFNKDWPFYFLSENLEHLDRIVADSRSMINEYVERLGLGMEKFFFLPTLCQPFKTLEEIEPEKSSTRVLWASRVDWQKRHVLLPKIASMLRECAPEIVIDVYGEGQWKPSDLASLEDAPNVLLHGAYEDYSRVFGRNYLCMIYTSLFDGIPTVILEAAGTGIPVIAPDVGGVKEHIGNSEAGILLSSLPDDDEMARSYVDAIRNLAADPARRSLIITNAYRALVANHSSELYIRAVSEIVGCLGR